jgi:hypothetical protein
VYQIQAKSEHDCIITSGGTWGSGTFPTSKEAGSGGPTPNLGPFWYPWVWIRQCTKFELNWSKFEFYTWMDLGIWDLPDLQGGQIWRSDTKFRTIFENLGSKLASVPNLSKIWASLHFTSGGTCWTGTFPTSKEARSRGLAPNPGTFLDSLGKNLSVYQIWAKTEQVCILPLEGPGDLGPSQPPKRSDPEVRDQIREHFCNPWVRIRQRIKFELNWSKFAFYTWRDLGIWDLPDLQGGRIRRSVTKSGTSFGILGSKLVTVLNLRKFIINSKLYVFLQIAIQMHFQVFL